MMRDWQKLKAWAESYRNCPADFQMGAEVVRLVMEDLLALMAENEELRVPLEEIASVNPQSRSIELAKSTAGRVLGGDNSLYLAWREALDECAKLRKENESVQKDAERYRYLRTKGLILEGHDFISFGEIADYRVDDAMKGESDV